ncbi:MAG TPA: ATP-binding protein [Ruminococcaceae bacterium]|nr:ATP-binding protein [Oscillospiraceae bacterium]
MKQLTIEAATENIETVTSFVIKELESYNCPLKAQTQIAVAIDELFGNIAQYAYTPEIGDATVQLDVEENPLSVIITFIDNGVPFNPLEKKDPNIHESVGKRKIGGLGIYIVKKTMTMVDYEYKDGQNILTVKKNFEETPKK